MLNFRKAQLEDCRFVFELRNDPKVRAVSFSGDEITYDSHVKWYEASLNNPKRRICIVEDENVALGVIRFDISDNTQEAVVSINISPNAWGKGVGSFALQEGEKMLKEEFNQLAILVANVMDKNEASKRLFQKCNYKPRMIEFSKEVK